MGLKLLQGESLARDVAHARLPSLAAQPFRPGELTMPIRIELPARSAARVYDQAGRTGLPLELWIRLGVEACRHVDRVVDLAGLSRSAFITELDERAAALRGEAISTIARGLRGYAHRLRAATPVRLEGPSRSDLTLLLPDSLATGWAAAANSAGLTLSAWIADMSLVAPAGVVAWEAAAAEVGDSLGEWILTVALRPPA